VSDACRDRQLLAWGEDPCRVVPDRDSSYRGSAISGAAEGVGNIRPYRASVKRTLPPTTEWHTTPRALDGESRLCPRRAVFITGKE
jgi:hypothetical protein